MRTYPDWLHVELVNWSRWCWSGAWPHPLPPSTCGSIEAEHVRYRTENTTDEARDPPPYAPHAEIVQATWERMDDKPKRVLLAEYPQRHKYERIKSRAAIAKRIGLHSEKDYSDALTVAVEQVRRAFEGKR